MRINARTILTTALLSFVAASFGFLALRSTKAAGHAGSAVTAQQAPPTAGPGGKVVAYYFHVTVRCTTCRNIESYSKEVIHNRFASELSSGQLQWRLVNVQLPENRNYINDYQLFTRSLVLVRESTGKALEYKVLNETWELVGDKAAMQQYVEQEVRGYLRKAG